MNESWNAAWESALDDLELTLEETEHLLQGGQPLSDAVEPVAWAPPVMPCPLPAEMVDRARELLGRQQDLILRTTQAAASARTSASYVDRVTDNRAGARPIYVDVSA